MLSYLVDCVTGIHSFVMFSNGTEILGIALNETYFDVQALAPISRIDSAISIDYDAGM